MKRGQLRLISRGLDGELHPGERSQLDRLLASVEQAQAVNRAWEAIGDGVRSTAMRVPIQDEALAWQDICRAIRQQEASPREQGFPGLMGRLRWASALAALLVLGSFSWTALLLWPRTQAPAWTGTPPASRVEWVVPGVAGATTMIYTDEETDLTVIWMDVAQADDPRDT